MFDIGWTEMAIIVLVALVVIGPKDLPQALRMVGKWMRKARSLTREFQSGIDEMLREAELDDARKAIESATRLDLDKTIEREIDPTGEVSKEVREAGEAARRTAEGGAEQREPEKTEPEKLEPEKLEPAEAPALEQAAEVIRHPNQAPPAQALEEQPAAESAEAPAKSGQRGKTGA